MKRMSGPSGEGAERLLRRCRRGDSGAWHALIARYQSLVYSVARRSGVTSDDADDVFQSTFLALYKSLDTLESPEALPKWLAVTAARESYRMKRLSNRTTTLEEGRTLDEIVADEDENAEVEAIRSIRVDSLQTAARELPQRCRDLVEHLYFRQASYLEIAEIVGIPVGAIGPTRARCLEKLRKLLEDRGFFDESVYHEPPLESSSHQRS